MDGLGIIEVTSSFLIGLLMLSYYFLPFIL